MLEQLVRIGVALAGCWDDTENTIHIATGLGGINLTRDDLVVGCEALVGEIKTCHNRSINDSDNRPDSRASGNLIQSPKEKIRSNSSLPRRL